MNKLGYRSFLLMRFHESDVSRSTDSRLGLALQKTTDCSYLRVT